MWTIKNLSTNKEEKYYSEKEYQEFKGYKQKYYELRQIVEGIKELLPNCKIATVYQKIQDLINEVLNEQKS